MFKCKRTADCVFLCVEALLVIVSVFFVWKSCKSVPSCNEVLYLCDCLWMYCKAL